ncbi:hypothetical protein NGA84_10025 [Lactococcus formosensis]|uniref:Uncharacterized protein n=1 Tax=Lactococcus formosensis TaxID=1281486 RepID=A0A9X4PLC3_9LACT|nr:hypothetical protein [Lactococcus formosensis]MDG6143664.1 hypothetical protein [Lactococcus formosensis]MDG6160814.1 hypothetical protein [Lactococcus formosensis]MDG6194369.1 hypothetical protein [Lactococcus formosensis]
MKKYRYTAVLPGHSIDFLSSEFYLDMYLEGITSSDRYLKVKEVETGNNILLKESQILYFIQNEVVK